MAAPVLIIAIGNESRGDDALGPLLLRQLDAQLNSAEERREQGFIEQFELIEEFQLQIEHAMDMKDRKLVLFIDAGMDTPAPFSFYRARLSDEPTLYSHALAPEALLKVYTDFYGEASPDAFVLCIRGDHFELGEPPSSEASSNLRAALTFSGTLMLETKADFWDQQCTRQTIKPSIRSVHLTR